PQTAESVESLPCTNTVLRIDFRGDREGAPAGLGTTFEGRGNLFDNRKRAAGIAGFDAGALDGETGREQEPYVASAGNRAQSFLAVPAALTIACREQGKA